jgi:hypothetical protein
MVKLPELIDPLFVAMMGRRFRVSASPASLVHPRAGFSEGSTRTAKVLDGFARNGKPPDRRLKAGTVLVREISFTTMSARGAAPVGSRLRCDDVTRAQDPV